MLSGKHIRSGCIYLFLVIYSFVIVKPLLTVVTDMAAHIFNEYEHISTVHFENGKYHIHAELAADNHSDKQKSQDVSPSWETFAAHIVCEQMAFQDILVDVPEKPAFVLNCFLKVVYAGVHSPPPETRFS